MDRRLSIAQQRLGAARSLAREGRHDEALQEHLWFHEHALEQQPSMAAVRLSFALSYWAELGKAYPKAREALEAIRDRLAERLLAGAAGWDAFLEMVAINGYLGCEDRTYALFRDLAASNEPFAKRCGRIALPSILRAGDYALAERFIGDPSWEVRKGSDNLNRIVRRRRQAKYSPAPHIRSSIDIYATDVKRILEVLTKCGRAAEARALRALAVSLVEATTIRRAVDAALRPGARPWYETWRPRSPRRRPAHSR